MKVYATLFAAGIILLFAACTSTGHTMGGEAGDTRAGRLALREDMRKLWTDHVLWTRLYLIAALGSHDDKGAAASRLMRNQEDIGNSIAPYYGNEAGARLTVLLKEHITIAVDLIEAARTGNTQEYARLDAEWTRNANDISTFLADANPNWPRQELTEMMKLHLSTTVDEVKARLDRNWELDVSSFDEVYDHVLAMADMLAEGIIKQFPGRFDD